VEVVYVFFDTETSGLPRNWKAPASDVDNWPRLVQIAWICCEQDGSVLESQGYIIKPVGFAISPQAARIHGITTARARREGVELLPVLEQFAGAVAAAGQVIAHNIDFDEKIVFAELLRAGRPNVFGGKRRICTMKQSADYCRLPGRYGYKWPTLSQLHQRLFGKEFAGAHGALADTEACLRCFFKLRELGVIV
jgi:DNA polymerase III epsilon subunit-like protein